jgi:hypothetical protein
MKATVTLQITVDEEIVAEKYPNYKENFEDINQFIEALTNGFETPMEHDGQPINYLKEYGYEVVIMDKKEGPWEQS